MGKPKPFTGAGKGKPGQRMTIRVAPAAPAVAAATEQRPQSQTPSEIHSTSTHQHQYDQSSAGHDGGGRDEHSTRSRIVDHENSSSHHTDQTSHSRTGRAQAQYDYVIAISQSKGRRDELLLKNKIQTIPTQNWQNRSREGDIIEEEYLYDGIGEHESELEESKSTIGEHSRTRTLPHHSRLASLYGPIPDSERVQTGRPRRRTEAFLPPSSSMLASTSLTDFRTPSQGLQRTPSSSKSRSTHKSTSVSTTGKSTKSGPIGFGSNCVRWFRRQWTPQSDISEDDRLDAIGEWDYWKGYYCGEQSQDKKYKPESLSWTIMLVLGQCGFMELVHYVHKWGSSFMLVAFIIYVTIGYSMYVLESSSGQYSGRKPLQMIRYLCPSLTGLAGILYLRTVLLAVRALGIFLYATYFALHFLSCTISDNQVLSMFNDQTLKSAPFPLGQFTITKVRNVANIMILTLAIASICVLGFKTMNKLGRIFRIVMRILAVVQILYFIIIWIRYQDSITFVKPRKRALLNWAQYNIIKPGPGNDTDYDPATIWQPVFDFMEFRPLTLLTGRIWIDAIVYVVSSLILGTLVHPYLNSRSAFHYKSGRDGILISLYSLFMNYLNAGSVILWMAYIAPNKRQITGALENLSGVYGILIIYAMQHHQAQYTEKMETDILFWAGIFYLSLGLSAYLAVNGYIHILTHCSYQERTSAGVKVIIYLVISAVFLLILPVLLFCKEGIQHLIFIDFYANRSMPLIIFTCGTYFWAVAYGHGLHKFVYDFRNMMHFDMFRAEHVSSKYTKWARFAVSVALIVTLAHTVFLDQVPIAGNTNYRGLPSQMATSISWILCITVLLIAVIVDRSLNGYTGRKNENKTAWRPHRDYFKNPFHYKSCFIKPVVVASVDAVRKGDEPTSSSPEGKTKPRRKRLTTEALTMRMPRGRVSFQETSK